jgi:hypothetical protein
MNEGMPKFQNAAVDKVELISERNSLIDKKTSGEKIDEARLEQLTKELDYYDHKDRDFRDSGHM